MNKTEIREEMRRLRRDLTKNEIAKKSKKIQKQLLGLSEYVNAETIMVYISAFREPSTIEIIRDALKRRKRVIVPVSDTRTETIILSYLNNFDDLRKGAYGIYEPKVINTANAENIDLVIIPGLAFDKNGARLGFGKGYYDKLLCNLNAEKIALCYEFQMFDKIPSDEHDVYMNTIITEDRIYVV